MTCVRVWMKEGIFVSVCVCVCLCLCVWDMRVCVRVWACVWCVCVCAYVSVCVYMCVRMGRCVKSKNSISIENFQWKMVGVCCWIWSKNDICCRKWQKRYFLSKALCVSKRKPAWKVKTFSHAPSTKGVLNRKEYPAVLHFSEGYCVRQEHISVGHLDIMVEHFQMSIALGLKLSSEHLAATGWSRNMPWSP